MASDSSSEAAPRVDVTREGERTTIVLHPAPTRERLRHINWIGPGLLGLFIALTFWGPLFGAIVYSTGERESVAELSIVALSLLPLLAIASVTVVWVMARRTGQPVAIDLADASFTVRQGADPSGSRKPWGLGETGELVVRAVPAGDTYKLRVRKRQDEERGLWLYAFSAADVKRLRDALLAAGVELLEAPGTR